MINENGIKEIDEFKGKLGKCIADILCLVPDGREKSLFVTHLETGVFFAVKAISGKTENKKETISY
jgi:hypothetical protein